MSNGSYLRFTHKCDVYQKTITTSAAGQKVAAFTMLATIPGQFQAPLEANSTSERRVAPYQENLPKYELIVPAKYAEYITYSNRIKNIVDRYSNVIESSNFEIIGIQPNFSFSGRKHSVKVSLRRVVEGE